MARANQRPSETPARSSNFSVVPSSVAPSSPNPSSDKENQSNSAPRDKGKVACSRLHPTPTLLRGGELKLVLPLPLPMTKNPKNRASTILHKTNKNARR
ncbi:unnamed protein product [Aureobasidium mustum]|uniref:Uncharacterized protein n=1 Tax=Aureobasidium mustum TaxID=2773714 RepID=A0A9N8K614_9PEZI|nr:unnamed protein product [Aureobasidium mustum]